MNHLGDTNKMVSETPRTDENTFRAYTSPDNSSRSCVSASFARQLERELNAANYEVQHLREVYIQLQEGNERQRQRIKRLEEALDLVIPNCSWVHHSKKHQHKCGEPCPVVALIEKSKEAKL